MAIITPNPLKNAKTVKAVFKLSRNRLELDAVICTYHDVTELKQAQETLRKSEERYRSLFENMLDGYAYCRMIYEGGIPLDFVYLDVNPAFERLTGLKDVAGKRVSEVIPGIREANPELFEIYGRVAMTGKPERFETYLDSLHIWFSISVYSPAKGYFVAVFDNITERKHAEEALQRRTLELEHLTETLEERVKERAAQLASLSSELLVAQEKERRRISYNLHDNVWQTLEIIKTQLEHLFSREDEADWPAYHQKAKQLIPVIRDTIARVRSMQGDLWPSVLDDIGIVATLEWYCREFGINHPGLGIEKNVGLTEEEVPASAKIVIYRVMQEALSNVAKHSQASHVSLSLNKSDHRLEFVIKDNGIGFDPGETIVKRSPWGGLGLLSMKERTELSGGFLKAESAKGEGTTIRASWPLSGNN